MIGDTIIGRTTFSSTPLTQCTVLADASAAPTSPPISACDEDEGRPTYQVMKFQAIAPSRAARTTAMPVAPAGASMIDEAMVTATPVDSSAPTRLATAATVRA